ncbi:MAG: type II toxin-antitoxin system VapC family toxin [Tannerella sp.]|jgi:predicted nucleic acid-binding protein|nr:type II toxin-antitoxin system VapC family toxin [Tannerella sp.]
MILCDTNILIESYRNNRQIIEFLDAIHFENVAISDVTRAELLVGARNKHELQTYIKELRQLTQYSICSAISTFSIELLEAYYLSHGLDFHDALIAATAIHHDIELYTLNVKDFIFIPGIRLYHP